MPKTAQKKVEKVTLDKVLWCGYAHTTHNETILVIHDTVCKVVICPATNKFRKTKQIKVVC